MRNRWWTWAALGCVAVSSGLRVEAQEEPVSKGVITFVNVGSDTASAEAEVQPVKSDLDHLVAFYDGERTPARYWIGVSCEPVSDSLRNQLDLEAEAGLLVNEVMDDSPAKSAGIQPHDVLISVTIGSDNANAAVREHPLNDIGRLNEVVQQAELKPLKLVLIRKGKPQSVDVTPVERPQPQELGLEFTDVNVIRDRVGDPQKVRVLLQQLQDELGGGPQMVRLRMAAPVVVAAPPHATPYNSWFAIAGHGLPEGMTLTITKSGNNPARIEVKKGEGQVWGANENEIETLPPESQGMAKAALAGMSQPTYNIAVSPPKYWAGGMHFISPGHPQAPGWSDMPPNAPTIPPAVPQPPHAETARQLAELHRQLAEELTKKGNEHADVQRIKSKIEALQQELAAKTRTMAAQNAYRSAFTRRATESKPVMTPPQPAPVQQQQIELLQKQIQELTHMQAKQAEAQQQQMRELQRALEKIATKE